MGCDQCAQEVRVLLLLLRRRLSMLMRVIDADGASCSGLHTMGGLHGVLRFSGCAHFRRERLRYPSDPACRCKCTHHFEPSVPCSRLHTTTHAQPPGECPTWCNSPYRSPVAAPMPFTLPCPANPGSLRLRPGRGALGRAAPKRRSQAQPLESSAAPGRSTKASLSGASAAGPSPAAEAAEPALMGEDDVAQDTLRLAIVGDVHGAWLHEREDVALRLLNPHMTLLVGDFGNEAVALVQTIASLDLPKAVILGNHDAWCGWRAGGGLRVAVCFCRIAQTHCGGRHAPHYTHTHFRGTAASRAGTCMPGAL